MSPGIQAKAISHLLFAHLRLGMLQGVSKPQTAFSPPLPAILLVLAMAGAALAQAPSIVTLDSNKVFVINGRNVFPIGFFSGPPINGRTPEGRDGMQEFRDAGALLFKMIQTNNWSNQVIADQQAVLDWAYQHAMFCWVNLREISYFSATDTNKPTTLRNVVDTFRNHPAVGLWANQDEAWWGGISEADLQRGYDLVKQEDANHPILQNHAPRGTVADLQPYNAAADILSLDIYPVVAAGAASNPPITNTQISQVGDWTQVLGQVANGQKPYWLIEQIAFSGTVPPDKTLVFPTFLQSRFMAYQAIANGARGLMFFGGNLNATLNSQDAPLGWNWTFWTNVLKPLVQQLGDHGLLANALVAPASTLPITISGTTAPDIEFCVRETPNCVYILATKREGATVNVTFSGLPAWAATGEVLFEFPRTVTAQSGQFTDSFAPLAVHVYRFSHTNEAPRALFPPQNRTNDSASTATFSVIADGTGPIAYQWRKNGSNLPIGGNISGATSSSLTLSNVSPSDAGAYDVVVTGFGSVTSAPLATLTVITNDPPRITLQPQSRTNSAGTTATFSVVAGGSGPLAYQWRKNGSNLSNGGNVSGATSSILALLTVSGADAGGYDVIVTGFGSITSVPPATLTITPGNLILYESFDYANLAGPVSSNTPANWTYGGSGPNDLSVVSGNLSYPGLAASIGNSVTNGGAGLGVRRLFGTGLSNGVIYFSGLFRINNLGYGAWDGASTYAGALCATDNTSFKLGVMVKSNSPSGYLFGVQKSGTGATTAFGATEYHPGDTVLLVGKYDFTVSPNTVSLWLNPDSSTFAAVSAPTNGSISVNTGTDATVIDRFNIRQNIVSGPSSVPAAMQWDELRIGLTWAAVTPIQQFTLMSPKKLGNGPFQFGYTNISGKAATIYASTNLAAWFSVGVATQLSPGFYQFTDPSATNYQRRFYQLRSP